MLSIKFDDTYLNKNQIPHSVKPAKMKVKCFGCRVPRLMYFRKKGDAWRQEYSAPCWQRLAKKIRDQKNVETFHGNTVRNNVRRREQACGCQGGGGRRRDGLGVWD